MSSWAKRIKEILDEPGVKQAALARACKITRSAVTQWKDAPTDFEPNGIHVFAISDVTGFAARWIATGEGPKRLGGGERGEHSKMLELWKKYNAAPESARNAIDALLEFRLESTGSVASDEKKKLQPRR